jgi:hypothetical protein
MRVSTGDQNLDLQIQALETAGCARIFRDHGVSGAARQRPGLAKALKHVKEGDVLVVWKLDRLGRSLPHLVEVIDSLREIDVGFRSLQEQIDTTSAGGRFYLRILAALWTYRLASCVSVRAINSRDCARVSCVRTMISSIPADTSAIRLCISRTLSTSDRDVLERRDGWPIVCSFACRRERDWSLSHRRLRTHCR